MLLYVFYTAETDGVARCAATVQRTISDARGKLQ